MNRKISLNKTVKVTVTISAALYDRIRACMTLEGNRVVTEFLAVAASHRCRAIEQAYAEVKPKSGNPPV